MSKQERETLDDLDHAPDRGLERPGYRLPPLDHRQDPGMGLLRVILK